MIERIRLNEFKGSTVDVPVAPKMLIVGPNGSGKSSIVQAIELVLTGSITGMAKSTAAIGDAGGAPFSVEATISGTDFNRTFRRSGDSIVQTVFVDRMKVNQQAFDRQLGECQAPAIWQPESFFALSPGQMIAKLVGMFGGYDDQLDKLSAQIETLKSKLAAKQAGVRESEALLGRLLQQSAKIGINAPSGSLAEVQAEIRTLSEELERDRQALADARAEAKAQELAQKLEEKKAPPADPPLQTTKGAQIPLQDPAAARQAEEHLKQKLRHTVAAERAPAGVSWKQVAFDVLVAVEKAHAAVECPACKQGLVAGTLKVQRMKLERLVKNGN